MKVAVRDSHTLGSISPYQMASYLRFRHWRRPPEARDESIWVLDLDSNSIEVILPVERDYRDYASRISELLQTLETVEGRSQLEILKDVLSSSSDVIRLKLDYDGYNDASVRIQHGLSIVTRARDLILAAACSAWSPREFFPSRKPREALEYLNGVRLGQSEPGSYVLPIISPVSPNLSRQGTFFPEMETREDPFERKVTKTLAKSLVAIRRAAQQSSASGDFQPFVDAVPEGVSANLCDALVAMQEETDVPTLEINFSWASVRALSEPIESKIVLTSDFVPLIGEASRIFKDRSPDEDFELLGVPIRIDRLEGASIGTMTINSIVGENFRRVQVELNENEFESAARAITHQTPIRMRGELVKDGSKLFLQNPRHFEIIQGEED